MNTLLETKLFLPKIPTDLVPRGRLIEQLDAGIPRKLTLISGPAGFGKTSLALEWISSINRPAAWLSIDEGDNNQFTFFAYLVAALQRIDRSIGQSIQPTLNSSGSAPISTFVIELINDIDALGIPFVLVLDDYHAIQDIDIHEAMRLFLERQPDHMHLVITTRADPPLPLARLRAHRQMTEIRANQLRFRDDEAQTFLNELMHLRLAHEDVKLLNSRTEGWIAGLQLAALSLRDQDNRAEFVRVFSGSNRHIMDYLVDEVLSHQPVEVQEFLVQTSLLGRLNGSLCDTLLGKEDGYSQEILEWLDQANLFLIPMDSQRVWYRYHHFFAEFLRTRLRKSGAERVQDLHRLASAWFEWEGLVQEAIHHSLAAVEIERAAGLIEKHTPALLETGELITLLRWMKVLPEELIDERPWLAINYAWGEVLAGRPDQANRLLNCIHARLEALTEPLSSGETRKLSGNLAALRAASATLTAEAKKAKEFAGLALELLPDHSGWIRIMALMSLGYASRLSGELDKAEQAFAEVVALGKKMDSLLAIATGQFDLGNVYRLQGRLLQAKQVFEELFQLSEQRSMSRGFSGRAISGLASILYEQNHLEEAQRLLERTLKLSETWPNPNHDVYSLIVLTRIYTARGEWENAAAAFDQIRAIQKSSQVTAILNYLADHNQVRAWMAQGDLSSAVSWAGSRESSLHPASGSLDEFQGLEILTASRVWVMGYRKDPACSQAKVAATVLSLDRLIETCRSSGYGSYLLEALILRAAAAQLQQKTTLALELIREAVERAEPQGYIRIFVDYGQPAAELIYNTADRGILPEYCGRLLAVFSDPFVEVKQAVQGEGELIEPLSEREIEVLGLIAGGLSNSDIAQRLYLSLNTIKGHTRNIYAKLSVNSRTQALFRARALGILPPE